MILSTIGRSLLLLQLSVAGVVGSDTGYSIRVDNATTLEEFSLELSQELTREFSSNLLNEIVPTACCTHRSNGYQECHADHRCNSSKSKCLNTKRCGLGNVWLDVVPTPKTGCCAFDGSMTQCPYGIHADNPRCHYSQADCEDLNGGRIVCGGTWITEFEPSNSPTKAPSWNPTFAPTMSSQPSSAPTVKPTEVVVVVTPAPTNAPTNTPTNGPTSAPTNAPSNAPTNTPTSGPTNVSTKAPTNAPTASAPVPLVIAGDNGTPAESFPLGLCEGDCDNDGQCQYGLFCFERDGIESVPGCEGTGQSGKDYCSKCPVNHLCTYGDEGLPIGSFPLGECHGDCDDDSECAPGLMCFQRNGIEEVPGCTGPGESGRDYCFDPNNTVSPSASPSGIPPPTSAPTKVPTHAPTNSPTPPPVDIIDPRSGTTKVTCPPVDGGEYDLPEGLKLFGLSGMNEYCGVFIKTSSGNLIPFARSYDSSDWEPAAGPHACLQKDITCNIDENGDTFCGLDLPSLVNGTLGGSSYIIVTKDGNMDVSSQIAAFLEMTTFGPTKSEIDALNAASWDNAARAGYIRSQMDMPATSHREYYRRRVNTKWDATQQSARSDHPCSPNSKWRKYAFIKQDRHDTITSDEDIHTTFEVVPEETDLVTTIYEAEDSSGSVTFDRGSFLSSNPGFSGSGYYDMSGDGDFIQWSISSYLAGSYPVSFRYAHGSTGNNGQRPLDLYVNDMFVKTMDFTFTDWWQYYKYTELVDVNLVEGTNTIKLLVSNGYGGPNIDHMRIGKPPAVVIKTNGWPRTIAKNGVGLLDGWGVDLNGMAVTMPSYPDPPQGDLFRYVFGRTKVELENGSQKYLDIGNPPIDFTGYEQYLTNGYFTFSNSDIFTSTASHLFSYPLLEGQEYILTTGLTDDLCNSIPPVSEEFDAPVFGKLPNGEWLVWSPSILLEDNGPSINAPTSDLTSATLEDGGGTAVILTNEKLKCANVPRTFVNEDTCVLSTLSTACKASELSSVDVEMSKENVKKLYNLTGHYVYAIRGLAMEELHEHPCSKPKSRWEISTGVTCPSATVLNADTIAALTDAITKSFDSNPFIKDVTRTLLCNPSDYDDSTDELDIQLQIGSDCYTHVHPDHLNVYDFSGWVSVHNGGAYNIQKWAQGFDGHEGWYLMYPYGGVPERNIPQHPMSRWVNNGNGDNIVYVGRLGDSLPYRDLIDPLKTDAVANYFGASASGSAEGVIICGSHGEVANDPSLPEIFDLRSDEQSTTDSSVLNNQKHVVWTEVNLKSSDQLRQRVAWALSQILTIVPGNIDGDQRTEMYTYFYDILVRHAFGNYRDILGEISFSPLMAEHLSYLKSKSHSYVFSNSNMISRADENYAREIMQLFSIGLLKLNIDGTIQVDVNGVPLQAYTNEDIESFARAWTGFDRTAARGNIEQISRGSTDNRLDPMQIVPDWRDPFPKSNLDGGFIGDRYELCVDITTKSFLKKGAHYRLLGGSSSPEMTKDPSYFSDPANSLLRAELDPTSALYLRLHNEGIFELDVFLENDLTCVGIECNVDTLRVVKVGNVYYEFVEKPCVQLAFYDNAKRIQLRDNTKQGQMCANPDLPHAREACCRGERFREVRSATTSYLYDGERMTFSTAEERCGSLCMFEDVINDNWWKKGYHWTPKGCSILVKINSEGYVAIVHDTDIAYINTIPYHVQEDSTLNWFRVFWDGNGDYPGSSDSNNCAANYCKTMSDGSCLCKTKVTDTPVFSDTSVMSVTDVLSQLFIGASGPPPGSVATDLGNGIVVHKLDTAVDESTVFEVSDDMGRTFFLKNVRSTVNVEGWEGKIPEIYEAEDATKYNVTVKSSSSATGGKYIDYDVESYLEWNVAVNTPGTYKLSFRYALDNHPWPLSVIVNSVEVTREAANPTIPIVYYGSSPSADKFPLQRCEGDCDNDDHCADGLFCKQNNALEENPGCEGGSGSGRDYCVDPLDYTHGVLFYPTGGWSSDWLNTDPIEIYLAAGQNTIRAQVPVGYKDGPNIDHMKLEGHTKVSAQQSSFRNPPHFMSIIPDYSPYGIGEMNLRDALYETEAVLDHYFYQDNVAPFLCTRMIQRFGISNPSPRYVEACSTAFKSGSYSAGSVSFGSGDYGSLEAMVAAITLDNEATSSSVTMDPGYGSVKEPIMKVMAVLRSMEYQHQIPDTVPGPPMHNDYHVRLWYIHEKIGQGPYEFPTVFSFFLPEYIPDVGPALAASLVSPETMILTMPNTVSLLNGLFSLIKYGLGDCNNGFSTYPGFSGCSDDGKYERSFGRLSYEPSGATLSEQIADLGLLLTAGRLSGQNQAIIEQACGTEPDEASILRCAQQLIVTTAEFHTTNRVERNGEDRSAETSVSDASNEPYKAIVYFYLGGGLDSYNMLVPYTCSPIDVYDKYRTIRGKNDLSEGIGLPKTRLLEITTNVGDPSNHLGQPCSSFGIHENLPTIKTLYDQRQVNFIANAGLLAKSVDVSNYNDETPVQLFAHNAMTMEAAREDLADKYSGTGVGGRMADVFSQSGIPTNTFSIDGQQILLTGEAGQGPSQFILSSSGLSDFNADPSIGDMNHVIRSLNNATTPDSGFFAETWSSKLSEAMMKQEQLKTEVDNTSVTATFPDSGIGRQLEMVSRIMQTRQARGVKRDIFYVTDGGYDTHADVDINLVENFATIDAALNAFVSEMKTLNLWESTTVVQFSEFARTLDPNTGDGSDHGWGGIHFMLGGSVNGGKVLGSYPDDFIQSPTNPIALSRGRMIPIHPWDAMWLGTAEWFGIKTQADLNKVLPMHKNFDPSLLYAESELFIASETATA